MEQKKLPGRGRTKVSMEDASESTKKRRKKEVSHSICKFINQLFVQNYLQYYPKQLIQEAIRLEREKYAQHPDIINQSASSSRSDQIESMAIDDAMPVDLRNSTQFDQCSTMEESNLSALVDLSDLIAGLEVRISSFSKFDHLIFSVE